MNNIEKLVFDLADPAAKELGYELCECEYKKEGPERILYLYIDKPGGVTVEDCEKLSRRVEPIIDEKDPIPEKYYLCVSSLGLDRPLKTQRDFERNLGKEVDIKFYTKQNGKKETAGILSGYTQSGVSIRMDNEEKTFDLKNIAKISLHLDFGGN